jgi:hypothetical protein
MSQDPFSKGRKRVSRERGAPMGRTVRSGVRATREGMALLVVLVLTMFLALAGYSYLDQMEKTAIRAASEGESIQAERVLESGVEWCLQWIERPGDARELAGGLVDNPQLFAGVPLEPPVGRGSLADDGGWRFTVLSSAIDALQKEPRNGNPRTSSGISAESTLVYGMDNLCAKVTLAQLIRWEAMEPGNAIQFFQGLPGGDPEGGLDNEKIQLAVRHWGRSMARPGPRTGRATIDNLVADERSLEEHHWDQLWTGGDLNQNYQLDPWEVRWRDQLPPWQRGTGRPNLTSMPSQQSGISAQQRPGGSQVPPPQGWQQWIAEFSGCRNVRRDGQPRISINRPDLLRLHQDLIQVWPAPWASYLIAFRQYGGRPASDDSSRPQGATGSESTDYVPDFSVAGRTLIGSPLDLIDSEVTIPAQSGQAARKLTSPIQSNGPEFAEQLDRLVDDVWFEDVEYREGVIDTLEAPLEVLRALPGLSEEVLGRWVQVRQQNGAARRSTPAWLVREQVLDLKQLRTLLPWLTCRSDSYRAQVVAFRDAMTPMVRRVYLLDGRRDPAVSIPSQWLGEWDGGWSIDVLDPGDRSSASSRSSGIEQRGER